MIGAGIFVLPGVATEVAGPAVTVSFVIGGVIALFTALSASELGTAMPKAGGSYYYVNHALGPLFGSIAGWGNWMGLAFASAFYSIGFGGYVTSWLPAVQEYEVVLSPWWALQTPLAFIGVAADGLPPLTLEMKQFVGMAAAVLFIGVNYIGAKETGRLQNIIVITLVTILAVFIGVGAFYGSIDNLTPFVQPEKGGWFAIMPATALVFVSYLGFAKITTVAEEIKDPGNNLPLAVIGSVVIVTIMYVVVMLVLTSVSSVPLEQLGDVAVVEVGGMVLGSFGVVATHIVEVSDPKAREADPEELEELERASQEQLDEMLRNAQTLGVEVETRTILTRRSADELFHAAREQNADRVVVGGEAGSYGSAGRFESALKDVVGSLPCDFVVFEDRGFEPDEILLPTAGGPGSEISSEIVLALAEAYDTEVTLMHVVDDEQERKAGEVFLAEWAAEHRLEPAVRHVVADDDRYSAIRDESNEHTLLVLGASQKGLLERLGDRDGVDKIVEATSVSVLLAQQSRPRSLKERLLGTELS